MKMHITKHTQNLIGMWPHQGEAIKYFIHIASD